ncbi:heat-inducible transcriptional repressor HrcA [Corynebacterium mastitidis]|uniref:Heat-inducible transcription repressor HrcA n=1 Tax=Corynebacterium mastitidis TaxID=161890 RepID=A0A2N0X8C6_9CORY|nr:heat-inducible transcriptional repressor HrcA [Corynebacterium mastitidis]MCH6197564.1 heat-inducible transcriptional repressor HrcA [Corynebacterium mastitidis]PKF68927.1 heat-inducible transcriptional repressor HrcA [Corynebacterium mastitidis]
MAGATDQRRREVLRAIVADYIASQEPVGSKALLERHKLNVSSATIRNDMAVLESEGYIQQQHASSGRIPTEKGYRQFVDSIHELAPLSAPERRAILSFLEAGIDLEDVLRRSVQLLSQLTRQVAMVQLPTLTVSRIKHCEVVALSPVRLLLVLITDTGRVEQRNVALVEAVDEEQVLRLRQVLNSVLEGQKFADASVGLSNLMAQGPDDLRGALTRTCTVLIETLVEQPTDRLILAGTSHLTRMSYGLPESLPMVLDALEEQVVVLRLLADTPELGYVNVRIGEENENEEFHGASVVTTAYGADGASLGGLGVVGPTYMDYTGTMSKVSAVARYVSRVLAVQ